MGNPISLSWQTKWANSLDPLPMFGPWIFPSFCFVMIFSKCWWCWMGRGSIRDIYHISGFISTKAHVPPLATGKCLSIILFIRHALLVDGFYKQPSNRHLTNTNCATTNIAHTIWKTFQFLLKRSICCPLFPCVSEAFMGFHRFQNIKENV